ncbi:MAG: hypothetical protein ACREJ2_08440, partial [Planctomycetota bacterium]
PVLRAAPATGPNSARVASSAPGASHPSAAAAAAADRAPRAWFPGPIRDLTPYEQSLLAKPCAPADPAVSLLTARPLHGWTLVSGPAQAVTATPAGLTVAAHVAVVLEHPAVAASDDFDLTLDLTRLPVGPATSATSATSAAEPSSGDGLEIITAGGIVALRPADLPPGSSATLILTVRKSVLAATLQPAGAASAVQVPLRVSSGFAPSTPLGRQAIRLLFAPGADATCITRIEFAPRTPLPPPPAASATPATPATLGLPGAAGSPAATGAAAAAPLAAPLDLPGNTVTPAAGTWQHMALLTDAGVSYLADSPGPKGFEVPVFTFAAAAQPSLPAQVQVHVKFRVKNYTGAAQVTMRLSYFSDGRVYNVNLPIAVKDGWVDLNFALPNAQGTLSQIDFHTADQPGPNTEFDFADLEFR